MTRHVKPQSWTQIAKGWALWAAMALQKDQSGQVLPAGTVYHGSCVF